MPKAIAKLTEAELQAELTKVRTAMDATQKALKPLQDKWKREIDRQAKLLEAMAKIKANDFGYVLANSSAYDQWQKMMPAQAYTNGYWLNTHEQAWQLKLNYQAVPDQELIDFIDKWLAHAKHQVISVFRHDLCERGMWQVERIGDEWVVYDATSYTYKYRQEHEAKFADTVEMLKYVAEHHWYEGGKRYDEDEDHDY